MSRNVFVPLIGVLWGALTVLAQPPTKATFESVQDPSGSSIAAATVTIGNIDPAGRYVVSMFDMFNFNQTNSYLPGFALLQSAGALIGGSGDTGAAINEARALQFALASICSKDAL